MFRICIINIDLICQKINQFLTYRCNHKVFANSLYNIIKENEYYDLDSLAKILLNEKNLNIIDILKNNDFGFINLININYADSKHAMKLFKFFEDEKESLSEYFRTYPTGDEIERKNGIVDLFEKKTKSLYFSKYVLVNVQYYKRSSFKENVDKDKLFEIFGTFKTNSIYDY